MSKFTRQTKYSIKTKTHKISITYHPEPLYQLWHKPDGKWVMIEISEDVNKLKSMAIENGKVHSD
ncbi:MAG: hypothetical protein KAS32_07190 [Candidatus Peribacteraceae bacterium]|nr:hypothetical protein [Candidatus Peribacteraceae bacterium]